MHPWHRDLFDFTIQTRRILPSLGITVLAIGLCYYFAETYQAPKQQQRLWPEVPPAPATVIALIGANVAVFALWRIFPPVWRFLNRYFINVPMYPYAMSMVGSVFSHQQLRHLTTNMVILWFIGTRREFIKFLLLLLFEVDTSDPLSFP